MIFATLLITMLALAKKLEPGFFSVPRHVFCYVDFLGHIAIGRDNTESAVSFIRDYFPSQYRDYAALIYSNVAVHEYKPKVFYAQFSNQSPKKVQVAWLSNNDNKQYRAKPPFTFLPMAGKRGKIHLCINICQLVDDLLTALDNFVNRLTSNSNLKRDCQRRLNNVLIESHIRQSMVNIGNTPSIKR